MTRHAPMPAALVAAMALLLAVFILLVAWLLAPTRDRPADVPATPTAPVIVLPTRELPTGTVLPTVTPMPTENVLKPTSTPVPPLILMDTPEPTPSPVPPLILPAETRVPVQKG